MSEVVCGSDGKMRCAWGTGDADYEVYHDTEWGFPQIDDVRLFEKICLEGFQAGLSWLTILRKRDNFRSAFSGFDFRRVAEYGEDAVLKLLNDAGIIRHRGKIEATINNAARALELRDEFGTLASYFWGWEPDRGSAPTQIPPFTDVSTALSKDLKKRGWKFVGPTTMYAFMQAMGLVNDHLAECWVREEAEVRRQEFRRQEFRRQTSDPDDR
ncbi:MAG: DNA-3-methyladenine glycosylase I [Armatimonadetes bacterium]|nr:MAG: DNA-3-methyladenine glycosylase I [Armatimonadota bacterium]